MFSKNENCPELSAPKTAMGIILAVLLAITALYDIFLTNNAFFGEWHDVIMYHLPYTTFEGGYSLWNNLWITGFPEFAGPQLSMYYPFVPALMALTGNIFMQADLSLIIHIIIGIITMNLFLSLFTDKYRLSFIFSMLFMFSACMMLRMAAGHELIVCAIAWIPLLYYAFGRFYIKHDKSVTNCLLMAVSLLLMFFTGAVYYAAYALIFLVIFALYGIISGKTQLKDYIPIAGAAAVCVLITCIKLLPLIEISPYLIRVDGDVDVFGGGGSLENNLASFFFGTPINDGYAYTGLQYGAHESTVFLGIAIVMLCIIGLVYGKKEFTIPAFFSIIAAFIWADAGKTIFSFIHLLPYLDTFRCPGRIFGALLPLAIALALYGYIILSERIKSGKGFTLDEKSKKCLIYGIAIVILLKLTELPYQEGFTIQAVLSLIIAAAFVAVIYFNKLTKETAIAFLAAGIIINLIFAAMNTAFAVPAIIKTIVLAAVIIAITALELKITKTADKTSDKIDKFPAAAAGIAAAAIILACACGFTFIKPVTPDFESSPANEILSELQKYPSSNALPWAVTTGWAFQDMDYSYAFMTNGIHSARAYNGYYLDTMLPLVYTIGDTTYFTVDYIVDTAYLSSGELSIPEYTFMSDGIPVTAAENVLPNAFALRNDNEIITGTVDKFTPDEIILTGNFKKGDIAVLKTAYYKGWTINGNDAVNTGSMVGITLNSDTDRIVFKFEPSSFRTGLILTIAGIILLLGAVVFRKRIENFYN